MHLKHNFKTSNDVGGIGESIFLSLMQNITEDIEVVSTKREWQSKGIDFLIDGVTYDTKFDLKAASTGNMAIETISRKKDNIIHKEGWLTTTEADCIVYMFKNDLDWRLYFFTIGQLAKLEEAHRENKKEVFNYGYQSEVVLIPLSALGKKKYASIPVTGEIPGEQIELLKTIHSYFLERKEG